MHPYIIYIITVSCPQCRFKGASSDMTAVSIIDIATSATSQELWGPMPTPSLWWYHYPLNCPMLFLRVISMASKMHSVLTVGDWRWSKNSLYFSMTNDGGRLLNMSMTSHVTWINLLCSISKLWLLFRLSKQRRKSLLSFKHWGRLSTEDFNSYMQWKQICFLWGYYMLC